MMICVRVLRLWFKKINKFEGFPSKYGLFLFWNTCHYTLFEDHRMRIFQLQEVFIIIIILILILWRCTVVIRLDRGVANLMSI